MRPAIKKPHINADKILLFECHYCIIFSHKCQDVFLSSVDVGILISSPYAKIYRVPSRKINAPVVFIPINSTFVPRYFTILFKPAANSVQRARTSALSTTTKHGSRSTSGSPPTKWITTCRSTYPAIKAAKFCSTSTHWATC